jgi:DNA-binding MarR family transcriptional regulator
MVKYLYMTEVTDIENDVSLSCENEALTETATDSDDHRQLYTRYQMRRAIEATLALDYQQFLLIRYKLAYPGASYEEMGRAMAMSRQAVCKIVNALRDADYPLVYLFEETSQRHKRKH